MRASRKHHRERGSVMVMFTLMLPIVIMLVGLAVDRTMLFIVETKLSAAVDGAALGAGRLLGTNANTTEIAQEFLNANFPSGYWGSYNLTPTITATTNIALHTITVTASVTVPLLFLRVFNQPTAVVGATAVATRRDSRIVMVLDRSGSMDNSGSMPSLISGATLLTNTFSPPNDELGLVVFSSTGVVAYPPTPRPYDFSLTNGGGPNSSFKDGSATDMLHQIAAIQSGGATNTSEAIALAYIELQKAYNRDIAANGSDNRLNAIVLFTDGMPTALSVYLNAPTTPPGDVLGSSSCTYKTLPASPPSNHQIIGGMYTTGNGLLTDTTHGLFSLATEYDDSNSALWWMAQTADYNRDLSSTPIAGCGSTALVNDSNSDLDILGRIPDYDRYNTSTDDSRNGGYQKSWLYSQEATTFSHTKSGSHYNGYQVAVAAWNAVDNIGYTIRTQTALSNIYIMTIGECTTCSNPPAASDAFDAELLRRLANTPDASSYDATQPVGQYVFVTSKTDLAAAFNTVAGALLRLAK